MEGGGGKSWREGEGSHGGRGSGGVGQWEWGKREGVRGQGGVRERGGGEVHSSFVGTHRPWAHISRGWGVIVVRGRTSSMGVHWSCGGRCHPWARIVHGRMIHRLEGGSCRPWALVICGGRSLGGPLSAPGGGEGGCCFWASSLTWAGSCSWAVGVACRG